MNNLKGVYEKYLTNPLKKIIVKAGKKCLLDQARSKLLTYAKENFDSECMDFYRKIIDTQILSVFWQETVNKLENNELVL